MSQYSGHVCVCARTVGVFDLAKMAVIIVMLYSLWYYVHFEYLPLSGEHGDRFMPVEFQRTLINNKHYNVSVPFGTVVVPAMADKCLHARLA